jgi:hypothetical protein
MAGSTPSRTVAKKPKKGLKQLSNAELLRLARKRKPPQSWYDEKINPFEPQK